ncbi:MAG: alpha/beta hydrolase [bacterium]
MVKARLTKARTVGFLPAVFAILFAVSCAAKTPKIDTPQSVASLEEVELGGVEQWVLLRGADADNPVLLFLHGGPGSPEMPTNHEFGGWLEESFVLVHWDQRGAGKSFSASVPSESMNVENFISDAIELTDYLRRRFSEDRIYIAGHSWGSLLGSLTVSRRPELYHAYVGIGQAVDLKRNEEISYEYVVNEARERNDRLGKMQLEAIGPPPYDSLNELVVQRTYLRKYGGATHDPDNYNRFIRASLSAPEYTALDLVRYQLGTFYSIRYMWDEVLTYNLIEQVPRIEVPVYFMHGRHDYNTPWELVKEYYRKLEAPAGKSLVWFESSAHSPNLEEPEKFAECMADVVEETYKK